MENSSGSEIFMVIIRIMMDSEILRISSTSSTLGCSGITRNQNDDHHDQGYCIVEYSSHISSWSLLSHGIF